MLWTSASPSPVPGLALGGKERLEDPRTHLGWHADTGVAHLDDHVLVDSPAPHRERATGRHRIKRIHQQIRQCFAQVSLTSVDWWHLPEHGLQADRTARCLRQGAPARLRERGRLSDHIVDQSNGWNSSPSKRER